MNSNAVGITEGADPTVHDGWVSWVKAGRAAVLVTKMPRLLLPRVSAEDNVLVHCTITGLGGSVIEPNVDPTEVSLDYYHRFCRLLGSDRVVLRVDPIVYVDDDSVEALKALVAEAEGKVRISFVDAYPHVRIRFEAAGLAALQSSFHMDYAVRRRVYEALGRPEVCAEPGLPCIPCVGVKTCRVLGVKPSEARRGQRYYCSCLSNKVELCYPPPKCTYGCLYCYWRDR